MSGKGILLGHQVTGPVTGAISAHRCCKRVAGGWAQCTVSGERVDGISAKDYPVGTLDAVFGIGGWYQVYSGAAFADAAILMTDAAGKAITYVAGAGVYRMGQADMAATGADQLAVAQHYPGGSAAA